MSSDGQSDEDDACTDEVLKMIGIKTMHEYHLAQLGAVDRRIQELRKTVDRSLAITEVSSVLVQAVTC